MLPSLSLPQNYVTCVDSIHALLSLAAFSIFWDEREDAPSFFLIIIELVFPRFGGSISAPSLFSLCLPTFSHPLSSSQPILFFSFPSLFLYLPSLSCLHNVLCFSLLSCFCVFYFFLCLHFCVFFSFLSPLPSFFFFSLIPFSQINLSTSDYTSLSPTSPSATLVHMVSCLRVVFLSAIFWTHLLFLTV